MKHYYGNTKQYEATVITNDDQLNNSSNTDIHTTQVFVGCSCYWIKIMEKHYERCIKQTPPRQVSILINDSDLREIALHDISKRTAFIERTLVVSRAPCFWYKFTIA